MWKQFYFMVYDVTCSLFLFLPIVKKNVYCEFGIYNLTDVKMWKNNIIYKIMQLTLLYKSPV